MIPLKRELRVFLGLAVALIVLLAIPRLVAADATFTSTADFDAGTKSDPGDGNYGVETITDNLQVASGSLELSSLKSDTFSHSDSDAHTFKWDTVTFNNPTVNQRDIGSGILTVDITQGSDGVPWVGVIAPSTISGVLDVRVKMNLATKTIAVSGSTQGWLVLQNEHTTGGTCAVGGGSTVDGIMYRYFESKDGTTKTVLAYTCTNGSLTQIGDDTTFTNNPRWLRMTRSSTTVTWYYSSDGSSWTQDETTTFSTSSSLYVEIGTFLNANLGDRTSWQFDDYNLASGTVDAGGYRTSGNWASASQSAVTDERFDQIVIDYSGASGSNYVTAISLFDSSSHYFFTDNTDLTTGSSHTYTLTGIESSNTWKVRVNLTGGNAGTPTILDIIVSFHPNSPPSITSTGDDTNRFGKLYLRTITFTDSDGDSMAWSLATNNDDLAIGSSNGTVWGTTWIPGSYYVNVTASDGFGGSDFFNYTLTIEDVATYISPVPAAVGTTVSFATDDDYDQSFTCRWAFGDGVHSNDCDATHTYGQSGTFSGTLTVTHGSESGTATFDVIVLPSPSTRDIAILLVLGVLWLIAATVGTILRTAAVIIIGGVAGLGFALAAWASIGDFVSAALLFGAAAFTLAWAAIIADRERSP